MKNPVEENIGGIVSINHEKSNEIFGELEKKNVTAAFREGIIRFSPHFYNTKEEIDIVISNLEQIKI